MSNWNLWYLSTYESKKNMMDWSNQNTWLGLINALGSLATFGGFVFFFLKDKQKEDAIRQLAGIADGQYKLLGAIEKEVSALLNQNNILVSQLTELENQTVAMQEANDLLRLESDKSDLARINEIKPILKSGSGGGNAQRCEYHIHNNGKSAYNIHLGQVSPDVFADAIAIGLLEESREFRFGYSARSGDLTNLKADIEILFEDEDGNAYSQWFRIVNKSGRLDTRATRIVK